MVKVMFGLIVVMLLCVWESIRYRFEELSHFRPNVFANASQTSGGRYRKGIVESIKVKVGVESKGIIDPFELVVLMAFKPTTKSRDESGASEKDTSLGSNCDASYPPNVKLPKALPFAHNSVSVRVKAFCKGYLGLR